MKEDTLTLKIIDLALQLAVLIGILALLEKIEPSVETTVIVAFWGFGIWFLLLSSFKKKRRSGRVKFYGAIDELTYFLSDEVGLSLQRRVGQYYVFSSRNRIIPNTEYIVNDCGDYCVITNYCLINLNDSRFEVINDDAQELRESKKDN